MGKLSPGRGKGLYSMHLEVLSQNRMGLFEEVQLKLCFMLGRDVKACSFPLWSPPHSNSRFYGEPGESHRFCLPSAFWPNTISNQLSPQFYQLPSSFQALVDPLIPPKDPSAPPVLCPSSASPFHSFKNCPFPHQHPSLLLSPA